MFILVITLLLLNTIGNHRIVVYVSLTGEHVTTLGYGGLLTSPSRIATDESGLIYITDNYKIQVFNDTCIKTITY